MENFFSYSFSENDFDKIKDLLISKDADAGLEQVLHKLKVSKEVCHESLTEVFLSHRGEMEEAVERREGVERLIEKGKQFESDLIKQREIMAEISACSMEGVERLVAKEQVKREVVAMMAEMSELFVGIEDLLARNSLHEASVKLKSLKKYLSISMAENEFLENSTAFRHLQQWVQEREKELKDMLKKEIDGKICWQRVEKEGVEAMTLQFKTENLTDLVSSLDCLGLLEGVVGALCDRLMRMVFREVILHGGEAALDDDVLVIEKQKEKKMEGKDEREGSEGILELQGRIKNVERVIDFLGGTLKECEGGCVLLRRVGEKMGGKVFEMVSREVMRARSDEDMASFEVLLQAVNQCRTSAAKCHLVEELAAHHGSSSSLSTDDAASAFVACKCRQHLISARSLLKQPLHLATHASINHKLSFAKNTNNNKTGNNNDDKINTNIQGKAQGTDGNSSENNKKKKKVKNNKIKGTVQEKEMIKKKEDGDNHDTDDDLLDSSLQHLFKFPKCMISKSIEDYWRNVEALVEEVGGVEALRGVEGERVLVAIRHIIHLFIVLSPALHRDEIDNLAFVAALHHNNCFFLAHQLILLHTKLPEPSNPPELVQSECHTNKPSSSSPPSTLSSTNFSPFCKLPFLDLVTSLRQVGVHDLGKLMNDQKEQITTIIKNEAVFGDLDKEVNVASTVKCMRMVLMKLQHMLRLWLPVLPTPVCVSCIGGLLGVVVSQVVVGITLVEDFSCSSANHLVGLLKQLHNDSLQLFTALLRGRMSDDDDGDDGVHDDDCGGGNDDDEYVKGWKGSDLEVAKAKVVVAEVDERDVVMALRRHVEGWESFQEVRWMMEARLTEIEERWAGGYGPLAEELSVSEVERLVRALFKNTKARSQVLASIKEAPS